MPQPIKSSDIFQNDGSLKDYIKDLEAFAKELTKTLKAVNKDAKALLALNKKLNASGKEGRKQISENAKRAEALKRQQKKYQDALDGTTKSLAELRQKTQDANRVQKLQIKLANAAEGSYDALSAQYSLNKIALNKMSEAEREAAEASDQLVSKTESIFKQMKKLQKETGKTSLNVGNYKEALQDTIPGIRAFNKALNVLKANPLIAAFTALAAIIGSLFAAFTRTKRGADLLARAQGALQGVMSVLTGLVDRLATGLIKLWEDPLGALQDFGKALKENVVNRIEGLLKIIPALGTAFTRLLKRDVKGAKEALSDAGQAAVQFATGLDEVDQKEFIKQTREAAEEMAKQVAAFSALAQARRDTARANRRLSRSLEELTTQEATLQQIADDATLSFKAQEEAAVEARKATEARAKVAIQIARNNLSLIDREIQLRRSNGEEIEALLDQQISALREVAGAERELTLAIADNDRLQRQLRQDRLERDLDILIDGFDNQKTINEKRIADDTKTFQSRIDLLEETRRLAQGSFESQIAIIEEFAGRRVDANEFILESDARVLNQRIRSLGLSEIIEGRLLEIVRDRKSAIQDLAEAEQDLNAEQLKNAIALADKLSNELDLEISTIVEEELDQIADLIDKEEDIPQGIKGLLGIDEDAENAIQNTFKTATSALNDYLSARLEAKDKILDAQREEVKSAEDNLAKQIDLQEQGLAFNAAAAREQLNQAKQREQEALRDREKASRSQARLQTLEQTGNLVTATSKIWAEFGNPLLAIPAIGIMWGSFIASKLRASKLATKILKTGGFEKLSGGSHDSGNDIFLGWDNQGRERRAEGKEGLAIFSRAAMNRYGPSALEGIVNNINSLSLEGMLEAQRGLSSIPELGGSNPTIVVSGHNKEMASDIRRLRENSETTEYSHGGVRIVKRNGHTRRYHG